MGTIRKRVLIPVLAALIGAAAITTAVYASGRSATDGGVAAGTDVGQSSIAITNCKVPKSDYITNDATGLGTTSTSYVAVPGMTKTVTIAGTVPSCIIATVSAL